jgi:hypothetical protein
MHACIAQCVFNPSMHDAMLFFERQLNETTGFRGPHGPYGRQLDLIPRALGDFVGPGNGGRVVLGAQGL